MATHSNILWLPWAQMVKYLPTMWEILVQSLSWEDPLEKRMETHSSILAWRISWTEGPGGSPYSPWGHKELDTTERLNKKKLQLGREEMLISDGPSG